MMKLLKYEFKRRKPFFLGVLVVLAALELLSIYNLYVRDGSNAAVAVVLSVFMIVIVYAYTWLSYVVDYYGEYTGKQRLLLLSIPKSSYSITGAKWVYVLIENLVLLIVTGAMIALTNYLWFLKTDSNFVLTLFEESRMLLNDTSIGFNNTQLFPLFSIGILTVIMQYIFSMATAALAITISTTIISGNKLNWLISLVAYWIISFVLKLFMIIPTFIIDGMNNINTVSESYVMLALFGGGYLIFIIGEYIVTNVLITKKLDV